ncbi:MAG: hypothetical protein Q4C95_04155 [Planctomycetia bacterium]|nr:hypothetical protein [Planctomycetia bacterium]
MYTKYWELQKKPFELGCDPAFFYAGETHLAVLLKLRYTIENRRGSALFCGTHGTGKSMIVSMLSRYGTNICGLGPFINLGMPVFQTDDILLYLADSMSRLNPEIKGNDPGFAEISEMPWGTLNSSGLYRAYSIIEQFLIENSENQKHTVLCVDDFHQLNDPNILTLFKSLMELQYRCRPILSLILMTTSASRLSPLSDQFVDYFIETKAEIPSLDFSETEKYIRHRLEIAEATREIFSPDSIPLIYEISNGIPRKINRICDLALLIGYAEKMPQITEDVIESLNRELVAS